MIEMLGTVNDSQNSDARNCMIHPSYMKRDNIFIAFYKWIYWVQFV